MRHQSNTAPRLLAALALALGICAAPAAQAADSKGQFALRGAGRVTCEQFIKALEERGNDMFIVGGWLDGYFTAMNQYSAQTFDVAPWQNTDLMLTLVLRNCRQDPQQRFVVVVSSMANAFKDSRLKERDELRIVKAGEYQVAVYGDTVKRVQEALAKLGHFKGKPDGQFGPATQAAIEAFQKANNVEVTGIPDQRTVFGLLAPSLNQAAQGQDPQAPSQGQAPAQGQGQSRAKPKAN